MTIIAFFYLLRVGEYTYANPHAKKRTRPFTIDDVTFWRGTEALDPTLPPAYLLAHTDAATMSILNQKNGKRNQSVHRRAIDTDYCPVRALIMRVTTVRAHTPNHQANISTYFPNTPSIARELTAADINRAIKHAVTALQLAKQGLSPNQVSSHSLRAGGTMAMYLNGVPHDTIRKMGRWTSDTFLMYIHEQIAAVSATVTAQMSQPIEFHNVLKARNQP